MYNKIILVGNLTRDIELRYTQSGTAIASTGIATSRKYKAQDGTQKEEVMFIDLTFFGKTGEIANQYLHKGSKVLVDGILKLDQWEDKNGGGKRSKHSVTVSEMKMLGSKNDTQTNQPPQQGYQQQQYQQPQQQYQQPQQQPNQQYQHNGIPVEVIDENEIPF